MRIPTALLGLTLNLAAPAAGAAPAEDPGVAARLAAAQSLHEQRQYPQAAAMLEELVEDAGRTDLLFNAGQSRFAAGHRAHALRLWQAYAGDPARSPEDLALVIRRIEAARALTTPVEVILHVPADSPKITLTIRRRYDPVDQERPPLALRELPAPVGDAITATVALDPGVWELAVEAEGRAIVRHELHVDRAPQAIELSLRPLPAPAPERVNPGPRRAVLLATAAVLTAPGAALVAVGARRFGVDVGTCRAMLFGTGCSEAAILGDARLTGAGAGLVGGAVGLAVAGVTAAFPVRRRAWWIELAVGGVGLAIGASWLGVTNLDHARTRTNEDFLARIDPWFQRRTVAASLLGAGAGLALGAATGLLARPPGASRAARLELRPALAPLGLMGHF